MRPIEAYASGMPLRKCDGARRGDNQGGKAGLMSSQPTLLRRSMANRQIAGVCAGLAEYFGLDPTMVRVGYVLLSLLSAAFPGILVYIILWVLIPEREYY